MFEDGPQMQIQISPSPWRLIDTVALVAWRDGQNMGQVLTSNTSGQFDISGHDGDPLSMDSTQVCVYKETNQISLHSLLQCI